MSRQGVRVLLLLDIHSLRCQCDCRKSFSLGGSEELILAFYLIANEINSQGHSVYTHIQ